MTKILMMASVSALALSAGTAKADYVLDILHINDFHSRIQSINKYDSTCSAEDDTEGKCFGGIARVKTKIDERREALGEDANVLVLSAGDEFQGSLFYTTYKGEAAAEFLNAMRPDAMAVGNHEFDDGPETLAKFIEAAEFPVISGNTSAYFEPLLKESLEDYVIIEKGGEKIGIVSVVAKDTKELSSPGDNVDFTDPVSYLETVVPEIESKGVNKIIALTHVGLEADKRIAESVRGVDVIVGGHSHTLLSNSDENAAGAYPLMVENPDGVMVPIVQAGAYSKYLGELSVNFDDAGVVTAANGDPHLLDASVAQDPEFVEKVAALAAPIEELKNQEVGETTAAIDGDRNSCRLGECEMGNLVADAMLDRVKDQGVLIAIQNGGGLRASIDAGKVTMGEVLAVLPFQNTLSTFDLTGADIIASLESGVSQTAEVKGRFPQVAGLRFTWDESVASGEGRVSDVQVMENGEWVDIDPEKTYGVVSNNFMRGGGDGYALFKSNGTNAYDYGPGLEQVVADYLAENSPYEPYTDGRIKKLGAEAAAEAETANAEGMETEETVDAGDEESVAASAESGKTTTEESAAITGETTAEESEESMVAADGEAMDTEQSDDDTVAEADEPADGDGETMAASDAADDDAQSMTASEDEAMASQEGAEEEIAEGEAVASAQSAAEDGASETVAETTGDSQTTVSENEATAETETMASVDTGETGAETMTSEDAAPMMEEYTVKAGDNLWSIAKAQYGDGTMWKKIEEANGVENVRRLQIGDVIKLPK